jgi:hypothetical protein
MALYLAYGDEQPDLTCGSPGVWASVQTSSFTTMDVFAFGEESTPSDHMVARSQLTVGRIWSGAYYTTLVTMTPIMWATPGGSHKRKVLSLVSFSGLG